MITAAHVGAACGLPVFADVRLCEKSFGVLEGLRYAEVQTRYPEVSFQVDRKLPDYVPPGGESLAAAQQRGIAALTDLARRHPGERLIVVSHGALLGMFLRHALGIALSAPRRFTLENGCLSFVSYQREEGTWHVRSLGETSHLRHVRQL